MMNVDTLSGMGTRGGRESDRRARGDQTRRKLINAARSLFVEPGYFSTSLSDIVARAGVGTRGAFYHHFTDKADLFGTVFEEVEQDLVLRFIANPPSGDTWDRLVQGIHTFLEAAIDPEVQRIMLIDGPAVLGWRARRVIEEANSIAAIEGVLRRAMDEGTIDEQPTRELAHVISAAVEESALVAAHADNVDESRRSAGRVLDRLLLGLLPAEQRSRQ
jgi:AcrR family transcriptional regulator